MAETSFQKFVNQEIPKRISIEVPVTGNLPAGKFLQTTGIGLGTIIVNTIPGSSIIEIEQDLHGFSVLCPIYFDGSKWQKARSNKSFTLATHVVIAVTDSNNFKMSMVGRYEIPNHTLAPGEYYYTSDAFEGQLTSVEPETYSNPIIFVESSSIVHILPYRPSVSTPTVKTTIVSEVFIQKVVVDSNLRFTRTIQLENMIVEDSETVTLNGLLLEKDEDYTIEISEVDSLIEELKFKLDVGLVDGDRIIIKATFEEIQS